MSKKLKKYSILEQDALSVKITSSGTNIQANCNFLLRFGAISLIRRRYNSEIVSKL